MNFTRLVDLLPYQLLKYPQDIAVAGRALKGATNSNKVVWKSLSTKELSDKVHLFVNAITARGLEPKDHVAILAESGSPTWNIIDLGSLKAGAVTVPIHKNAHASEVLYILDDAEIKYLFVEGADLLAKTQSIIAKASTVKEVFTFNSIDGYISVQELLKEGNLGSLSITNIEPSDLATIIYTSGTTGNPKGVMLSHDNIISNIKTSISLIPIDHDDVVASFLPMSHIFERMVTYTYLAAGASIYYIDKIDEGLDLMKIIRPNYFTSVPRLLEKMYEGILELAGEKKWPLSKIIHWSLAIGKKYNRKKKQNPIYWLKIQIANILVYRYWRRVLGGRVEGVMVGAAALRPELGRLFSAARIYIHEGYGLTETSPVISMNRFEAGGTRFGTVGIPIPSMEVKIINPTEEGDGEIVVKGPNVMMGYWKKPEETKKVIDKDGWFHTGDVGHFYKKRFLKLTDRKKDIFKTSSGKYIAPQAIENLLRSNPYIDQCMIIGFQRPFVSTIIVPAFTMLKQWCETKKIHWTGPQFMVINPKVESFYQEQLDIINEGLKKEEKIRNFFLAFEEWSVPTGELSQTLKLKRTYILDKFSKEVQTIYNKK